MFIHFSAAADSVWQRSWNHIYCLTLSLNKMCKWCSVCVMDCTHTSFCSLTVTQENCKSCTTHITCHKRWTVFFSAAPTLAGHVQHRTSLSSSCWIFHPLPTFHYPYKSPSVLTSRYAQWVNRRSSGGERRIRETWSSWVGVCPEIHIYFFFSLSLSRFIQLGLN